MGGKPRSSSTRAIFREVEDARSAFLSARERYERALIDAQTFFDTEHGILQGESGTAPTAPSIAGKARKNGRRSPGRRAAENHEELQERLLSRMRAGTIYAGDELRELCGSRSSEATFANRIRRPLLESGKLEKVCADGRPWRKGMSPAAVRWILVS